MIASVRVCVTGGRLFSDKQFVRDSLDYYHAVHGPISELGNGFAKGVDTFAREWAIDKGIAVRDYKVTKADWERYGDAAGNIRNGHMLDDFKPDVLLVFPGHRGTTDCTKQARKKGIERHFFTPDLDPFEEAARWG